MTRVRFFVLFKRSWKAMGGEKGEAMGVGVNRHWALGDQA